LDTIARALQRLVATRPITWVYLNVFPHVDRRLLAWTNGRLSVSIGQPVLLLTTVGAKSGLSRTTPLVYVRDGEDIVLIASNGGKPRHPAWYHNVKAHPEVRLTVAGATGVYTAHETRGAERERLWRRAGEQYAGFASYERRAGNRRIPVLRLRRLTDG